MKYSAAVITVSDTGYRGVRNDISGPEIRRILESEGWEIGYTGLVPDEAEQIKALLIHCSDELGVHLILTTGGTGFSPRDITPEVTKAVVQRETPGIPEAMRAESMKVTSRGCLSRATAGIRGQTLIVNLPGSEKAARENLLAVLNALRHGVDMLRSTGSADCASALSQPEKKETPSLDQWLREAKTSPFAEKCGMYLAHNGVVRATAKVQAYQGTPSSLVRGMLFSYDSDTVSAAIEKAKELSGIYYVRVWLNEGKLSVGDDLMLVLVGGDIRSNVVVALETLVGELKNHCVTEEELR